MRFSITWKLLLLVLFIAVLAVLSMAFSMRYGFDRGLDQYQQAIEQQFNDNLITRLQTYYQENDGWQTLRGDREAWFNLMVDSYFSALPEEGNRMREEYERFQAQEAELREHRPRASKELRRRVSRRIKDQGELRRTFSNVSLYDQNKKKIEGPPRRPHEKVNFQSITVDKQIIGYLGVVERLPRRGAFERQFSAAIKKLLTVSGFVIFILTATVAYPLVRYFSARIKKITSATQRVAAGDYSIRLPETTHDELGQLTQHFNHLTTSLERSTRAQKNMLADIAHELRTPVSVIRSKIEALQDGIHPTDEKALGMLHQHISDLGNLINDVHELSLSDIGALSYEMRSENLTNILQDCIEQFRVRFEQAGLNLKQQIDEAPIMASVDRQRLQQLLNNLFSNVCRYTDAPGSVRISMRQEDQFCTIIIEDSAPGVNERQLSQLFDRFFRTDSSRNKKTGGTGLGLSICQNIAEAHNGTLSAEHSTLGGLKMCLQIPTRT
ncbi:ATP-binding protein [Marinicella sp. W31]|uniref:ATP-binding protein n=1 Tax=Marinicella sp. W31 TaxID=3023713 RepID=UPI0037567F10